MSSASERTVGFYVLGCACAYALFGLLTVFWAEPGVQEAAVASGGFSLLWALATALVGGVYQRWQPMSGAGPLAKMAYGVAALVALLGIFQMVLGSELSWTVLAAAVWLISAAWHLVLVFLSRKREGESFFGRIVARDWLLTAVVSFFTGLFLFFSLRYGAHGALGIAGGGALILGVLWFVSGVGLILGEVEPADRRKQESSGVESAP